MFCEIPGGEVRLFDRALGKTATVEVKQYRQCGFLCLAVQTQCNVLCVPFDLHVSDVESRAVSLCRAAAGGHKRVRRFKCIHVEPRNAHRTSMVRIVGSADS